MGAARDIGRKGRCGTGKARQPINGCSEASYQKEYLVPDTMRNSQNVVQNKHYQSSRDLRYSHSHTCQSLVKDCLWGMLIPRYFLTPVSGQSGCRSLRAALHKRCKCWGLEDRLASTEMVKWSKGTRMQHVQYLLYHLQETHTNSKDSK